MLGYLNAGFAEVLGNVWLEKIASLGFTGIRTDIRPQTYEAVVHELGKFEVLSPIFLFGGGYMEGWTPEMFFVHTSEIAKMIKKNGYFRGVPVYFEIGNEPDIAVPAWRQDPKYLADTFWECYRMVKSIHGEIELVTGGIANLHENGLNWLEEYMSAGVPNKAIVGFHRYPNGYSSEKPHDGFLSRDDEMRRLQALAGDRRLLCTETGLSQGPHRKPKGFPLCFMNDKVWLEQDKQALAFKLEWNFYSRKGMLGMVWYQHRDAKNKKRILDNYGIYTATEDEKLICGQIRELLLG